MADVVVEVMSAAGSAALLAALVVTRPLLVRSRRLRHLQTSAYRATFDTLHTASLAAPSLREGLTTSGAVGAVKPLRLLLGTAALALTDTSRTLAVDGSSGGHGEDAIRLARTAISSGETSVAGAGDLDCSAPGCPITAAVASAVRDGDTVIGAIVAYSAGTSSTLVQAADEVARWVSAEVSLGSAGREHGLLVEAELRALRAQIDPHFVYNCLTAIASFVRTDPDRARELLLEFTDFTRYSLRSGDAFTTLASELQNTERYLVLEQARFGERLVVSLRVPPPVSSITLPYLVIQPLVENAVRHGLQGHPGTVTVSISAVDLGAETLVTVSDDGAGADPERIRQALAGAGRDSVGLVNVDSRLRQTYGSSSALTVRTAPGDGTTVSFRVPKNARPNPAAGPGSE